MREKKMRAKLEDFLQEVCEKTITNNQYPVLTSSKSGLFLQSDYFNKQVASKDNTGYKIIRRGQFTYRAMSDTGEFFPNMLECADVGIVSPAYPVFEIIKQDQIVPEYLNYYFKSNRFQNSISTFAQGSTRTSVKFGKLKKVSIELPEIKKQYQIIRTLDLLRTIINNRKKEVLELDELIRARFVEMFGNGHDGFCNTKKLGEFCKFQQGTQIPVEEQIEEQLEGYTRFLRIIDYTQAPQIPRYVSVKGREIAEDSVVIVRYGATAGFVGHGYAGILANNLFEVVPDESILSKDFLYLALKYGTFEQEVHDKAFGAAMPALSFGMMNDIGVVTPNSTAQNGFVDFVKQVDKSKHHSPHLPIPPLKWYPLSKNEVSIMEEKIIAITNEMAEVLNIAQLKKLQEVLVKAFSTEEPERKPTNHEYLRLFLEAKSIEGCSPRTLQYYEVTVQHLFAAVNMPVRKMTTERMREYLSDYQQRRNCSKATIDNIRRNISSFFSWLEEEDHILKSPMRRIHKIKTKKTVKEVISDEDIEKLRDSCTSLRDLAMIDLLYSTGIRVGELVRLNIEDVNFESRECVVFGKGDKERRVYFDAKTKIHLKNYLESRRDTNHALFVSLLAPYNRLAISGVEIRLRKMGRMLNLKSIHPHKFRRTMATRAIDKGMPIEQVQKILGHSQIDTTMQYAIVNQNNVKMSHQKYIA